MGETHTAEHVVGDAVVIGPGQLLGVITGVFGDHVSVEVACAPGMVRAAEPDDFTPRGPLR